jgi:phosphate uptake regulator
MGSMVANAINLSLTALRKRDLKLAEGIISNDAKINELRFEIEENCIQLIVHQ